MKKRCPDVFVRINSKGTPLNQADFILTLMSVFWDEGRAALEGFCRESRKPSKGKASPFNHFYRTYLRINCCGSAWASLFKRARLKYVYSILRGKDLETEKFSTGAAGSSSLNYSRMAQAAGAEPSILARLHELHSAGRVSQRAG